MTKGGKKPENAALRSNPSGKPSKKATVNNAPPPTDVLVLQELQQQCLNLFRDALNPSTEDSTIIQEVKGHLFNRDFKTAFGKEGYLRAYASRWSPSRALGYLQVLESFRDHLLAKQPPDDAKEKGQPFRVVCLGGGAGGELVALAGWLRTLLSSPWRLDGGTVHVDLIDQADWSSVTADLYDAVVSPPVLSAYATQAKKDANRALLARGEFVVDFRQSDVLENDQTSLLDVIAKADLVTCMFTLNELYATSMSKTQRLLSVLTQTARPGSHFLIVDSPGSYSTVSINGSAKKYPMQWLVDRTLRGSDAKDGDNDSEWTLLDHDDGRWFRLPQQLQYPIRLENMQYQVHLYRRKSDIGGLDDHHGGKLDIT